jgi:uncharacterized protein YcbK (DUF882 family)
VIGWEDIVHFNESEFRCKHCGDCAMDMEFVSKLDGLRDRIGTPVVVTSGYRCPAHNAAVSSTGDHGPHTTGKAADIQVKPEKMRDLIDIAVELFPGIGLQLKGDHGSRYIHVDDLTRRAWTY